MSTENDSTRPAMRSAIEARSHPFLADLEPRHLERLADCATERMFAAGDFLCREGHPADTFYLVREGRIVLEVHQPGRGGLRLGTVHGGQVLGWSWLVHPHRWRLDARCLEPVRAIKIDARRLRRQCQDDHELGYQLLARLVRVIGRRLHAARLRLQRAAAQARGRGEHAGG